MDSQLPVSPLIDKGLQHRLPFIPERKDRITHGPVSPIMIDLLVSVAEPRIAILQGGEYLGRANRSLAERDAGFRSP